LANGRETRNESDVSAGRFILIRRNVLIVILLESSPENSGFGILCYLKVQLKGASLGLHPSRDSLSDEVGWPPLRASISMGILYTEGKPAAINAFRYYLGVTRSIIS
jgi:hypothetical protein